MPKNQPHADNSSVRPISILACGGSLPLEVAQILRDSGRQTNIVSIKGMADADYSGFSHTSVSIGRIGALLAALRANGAREMVIAGHATRPDLRSINIDWGFVRHISTIMSLTRGGDDHVLRKIAGFFERCGLTVRSIAEVAPALLTPQGTLVGTISASALTHATTGLQLVHRLGSFDVGQAVVMEDDQVLAIEGAEGTDGLLARLPRAGVTAQCSPLQRTLVKAAKPEQDLRVDLPTIGAATIDRCNEAGIQRIALETGRSLMVDRTNTLLRARAANVAIIGLEATVEHKITRRTEHYPKIAQHSRCGPSSQAVRDVTKGLQLLAVLSTSCPATATIVTRENIIAICRNEPLLKFIKRTELLAQWGDRREKEKRNRTLVLSSIDVLGPDTLEFMENTKLAGIAVLNTTENSASFDQLVSDANVRGVFVLSAQRA